MDNFLITFLLTLIAGLCTGIGSCIAFFAKHTNRKFLSVSLGFSAGVMIYVSMIEIFAEAQDSLTSFLGEKTGSWITVLAFFGGMLLIGVIDKLIPEEENPHEVKTVEDTGVYKNKKLMRMGLFTALTIAIHNFLQNPAIAVPIVAAIAIHNIPEGIAVSIPIYQSTGSKIKAFRYSFLSGLAAPVGALVGWLILMPVMNDVVFGIIFAVVAGIMVFISFDELLPAAREYGEHYYLSLYGLIAGMAVMGISLLLFL